MQAAEEKGGREREEGKEAGKPIVHLRLTISLFSLENFVKNSDRNMEN